MGGRPDKKYHFNIYKQTKKSVSLVSFLGKEGVFGLLQTGNVPRWRTKLLKK